MPTDHSHIKSRALEMFQTGQGADFVIEVVPQIDGQEKKEFKVHKYVLMVNSDVFMAMFSHENTQDFREGRIQITDSTPAAVHQMLIFMYTGELPKEYAIETDTVPLMHLANKYQIKSLVELIEIEQELVGSLSLTNVFDRLEMANLCHMNALHSACGQLIRRNLHTVKKEVKWLELKKKAPELALAILKDSPKNPAAIRAITAEAMDTLPAIVLMRIGDKLIEEHSRSLIDQIPNYLHTYIPFIQERILLTTKFFVLIVYHFHFCPIILYFDLLFFTKL